MSDVVAAASPSVEPAQAGEEGSPLDFDPKFDALKKKETTFNLTWSDIDFKVKKKHILKGLSGQASSGEVVALQGPSGSGKSTLLNILAGRVRSGTRGQRVTGTLRVNGQETKFSNFRRRVAYVTQDDSLFPTATVLEALHFSARLRLPSSMPQSERSTLVEDIISSLGLEKCRNTKIGNELVRGLSGGEKKRCAIGVELVSNPACLFLDEPTSGLDSFSAWKVVKILKAIADTGCTILCSIHQPSSEVFNEFDSLILLGAGNIIYQGPLKELSPAFSSAGLAIPDNTNPSDHVMFLVQTKSLTDLPMDNENKRRNGGNAPAIMDVLGDVEQGKASISARMFGKAPPGDLITKPGTMVQMYWLAEREIKGTFRDVAGFMMKFGMNIVLGTLFAVLFMHAGDPNRSNYRAQSHFGAFINIYILSLMGAAQPALLTFPTERVVFIRERATNTYNTLPYALSKLLIEIPLLLVSSFVTMLITYWSMGFGGNFIVITLSLWATSLAATSISYMLGAVVPDAKAAMELAPLVLLPQLLYLGLFVTIEEMPLALQWIQYLIATKYALNLGMLTEFDEDRAPTPEIAQQWRDLKDFNVVEEDRTWFYALLLFAIFAVFRFISIVLLNERAKRF